MGTKTLLLIFLGLRLLFFNGCGDKAQHKSDKEKVMQATQHRQIDFETISGGAASLDNFKGNVLLIVNVASKCGFTKQYAGLEKLYRDKRNEGLIVIGFPSNDFGGQEPGTNDEILNFCQKVYDVTFPMMAKLSVKGENKHPLFVSLTEQSKFPGEIKWNFFKFLIDQNGQLVARFESSVEPMSDEITGQIKKLL